MARLELAAVSKRFGTSPNAAVDGVSLGVEDGELVCLLGPSGSGKSTVLRMIGGFEAPTTGSILIDGEDVTAVPPEKRPTGMVFQSHALWSHMTVFGNIAFGLKLRRLPRAEIARRVEAVLELVGLGGFGARQPNQLSGGQQQRVALARSLVLEPKILLLDEPFASLDQHLRERLREEVRDIQQRVGITTLFVTHGQDEALALADRIVVMRDGRIEQAGRPEMIYRDPRTPFVAGFIGQMNLVPAMVQNGQLAFAGNKLGVPLADGPALLAMRPEFLEIARSDSPADPIAHRVIDFGTHLMVDIELVGGERLKAMASPADGWRAGMRLRLWPRQISIYRDDVIVHRASLETPVMSQPVEPPVRTRAYV
jgi:putative spermidine/putrescine transport system ATP-binding protein